MTIKLGQTHEPLFVTLNEDADFIDSISMEDGSSWPAGLIVKLIFKNDAGAVLATFAATVTGPTIAWDVDKATVAPLIATATKVRLWYINGTQEILWGVGTPSIITANR